MSFQRTSLGLINALLRPFGAELAPARELERLRADGLPTDPDSRPHRPLPDEAAEYLRADNPRLRELIERYAKAPGAVTGHSLWTTEYIEREVELQRFRADNAYVYQFRDRNTEANHLLTAYYLATIDRLALLERLTDDELFGAIAFPWKGGQMVTRDLLDSIAEIEFLDETLRISERRDYHVLDIGAGYGRLAQRLVEAFSGVSVHATDALAVSTFLCEFNLRFRDASPRASAVPLDELDTLLGRQPIDLATNVHSFSECPLNAVGWWLDLLRDHKVPHLMIIPNVDDHGGHRLTAREPNGDRVDFLPELERRGYKLAVKRPKFADEAIQRVGVSPSQHYLFELHTN